MKCKRFCTISLVFLLLASFLLSFSGCALFRPKKKSKTVYGCFDTVSVFSSYGRTSKEAFEKLAKEAEDLLWFYHRETDVYHEYENVNNLCTLNENAGGEPLFVSEELFDLLLFSKQAYVLTNGAVNVMMGAVTSLWHDLREEGLRLPTDEELSARAEHISIDSLVLDEQNKTARIVDPDALIDVGAVAKGYACQKIREHLVALGADSFVLDLGGNLSIIGAKPNGDGYLVGIKNPDADAAESTPYVHTLTLLDTSLSTTGGYERYYEIDGKRYHHCIDPATLFPAERYDSVSVFCSDSGLCDLLSTALFILSKEDGKAVLEAVKTANSLPSLTAVYIVSGGVFTVEV